MNMKYPVLFQAPFQTVDLDTRAAVRLADEWTVCVLSMHEPRQRSRGLEAFGFHRPAQRAALNKTNARSRGPSGCHGFGQTNT